MKAKSEDACQDGREAEYYVPLADGAVECRLCSHFCHIATGKAGRCRNRVNREGRLWTVAYGAVCALQADPVEKKPLARFMPGSYVVSVGSYGCNLTCPFCQNFEISQAGAPDVGWREVGPEELAALAADARRRDPRVTGVAFTYNEPLVGWEYVRDASVAARERGLVSVLVSNGCAEPGVVDELAPLLDAANIDLKGFSPAFYEKCGAADGAAALAAVRGTIERLSAEPGCHVEVTTLVVPGMNDSEEEVAAIAAWLAALDGGHGAEKIVHHVTRFFPRWRMLDAAPTPVATVYALADVSRRWLRHVHVGNC